MSRPGRRSRRSVGSSRRPARVAELERLLRVTETALRRHLHDVREGHPAGWSTEVEERVQAEPAREMEVRLLEREARTRAQIREALERADRGQGDTCVRCGRAIGKTRLRALPFTDTCRECQEQGEASHSRRTPMIAPA